MKILYAFVFILASTNLGISQEICDNGIDDDGDGLIDLLDVVDCLCVSTIEQSILGDFEILTCCPQGPTIFPGSGFYCLDDGWQSPGIGTPDLYNVCGYMGSVPWFAPTPFPSGDGCVGLYNGIFVQNDFNEQVAFCLPYKMIPGFTYSFGFYLGFTVNTVVSPLTVDVHLQGTNDCSNYPINSISCVMDFPESYEITSLTTTAGVSDAWILIQTTFVATEPTAAISLGLECASDGGIYHFVDSIYLHGEFLDPPPFDLEITGTGDCLSGVTLSVPSSPGSTFQWYLDSIAIPAAISESYFVAPIIEGTYQVIIDNGMDCQLSLPYELGINLEVILIDESINQIICHNDNDGSIDIDPQSPNEPLNFEWNPFASTEDLINLSEGIYTITVTDANGCFGIESYTILNPDTLIGEILINQPVNNQPGSASVVVSGGVPTYAYSWSHGGSMSSANGLIPGSYMVTITDDLGCEVVIRFEIYDELIVEETVEHDSCYQSCSGSVTATVSGGLQDYSITWNNSSNNFTQTNLCPGVYSYVVVDEFGTLFTDTVEIYPAIEFNSNATYDAFLCDSNSITTIQIDAQGGYSPYTYAWSTDDTDSVILVSFGNYSVTITDINNCQISEDFNISLSPSIELLAAVIHDDCSDIPAGSIDLMISGGQPPYDILWNTSEQTAMIDTLSQGRYFVTVTDSSNCSDTASFIIESPSIFNILSTITNASCGGGIDGIIELNISDGQAPYTFVWEGGSTDSTLINLARGSYQVTITDANNCMKIDTFTVLEGDAISIANEIKALQCAGDQNGEIIIHISGGDEPYTIEWNTSETDTILINLAAGDYSVTVTDNQNCLNIQTYTIDDPDSVIATSVISLPLCYNDLGSISLTIEGGTSPYAFLWNSGETTNPLAAMADFNYSVTVTDANNCTHTSTYLLTQPDSLYLTLDNIQLPSSSNNDGTATINILGGTAPFNILWNDAYAQNTLQADSLSFGSYIVTVIDVNGCIANLEVVLSEDPLIVIVSKEDNLCFNDCFGRISLAISGGVEPYDIKWSTTETGLEQLNLCTDTYTVLITDAAGTVYNSGTIDILGAPEIIVQETIQNNDCPTDNDGSISLLASGGNPPYTYLWNNAATTSVLENITAGSYQVTITDDAGCQSIENYLIDEAVAFDLMASIQPLDCASSLYSIQLSGGNPDNYPILLNGVPIAINNDNKITDLPPGIYKIAYQINPTCIVVFDTIVFNEMNNYSINLSLDTIWASADESVIIRADITSIDNSSAFSTQWQSTQEVSCIQQSASGACIEVEVIIRSADGIQFLFEDENGCSFNQFIPVVLQSRTNVFVPNVFSPNDDGINDILFPFSNHDITVKTFSIFDRWGNVMYERGQLSLASLDGWDGTRLDRDVNQGVYVYFLEYEEDGSTVILAGDITLIR